MAGRDMLQFRKAGRTALRLAGDRRGNFAVLGGVTISLLAMAAGFGINIAQLSNVKSGLALAVDGAVTSTARDLTTGRIKPEDADASVRTFLEVNAASLLAPGEKVVLRSVTVDRLAGTVEATAEIDVDIFFPLFGKGNRQRVSATTASLYSDKRIEVAMMLDVTGSMGGQKIKDLKTAAQNAVDILLTGQDADKPRIRIALVPYAEAVNTGGLSDAVFVEKPGKSDLPPPIDAWQAVSASSGDGCASERKDKDGAADFSDDGPYTERENNQGEIYLARVNRDDRVGSCPSAKLIPLTADVTKLTAAIGGFRANGVTAGGIAAQWGYYMLSPKWRTAIKDANLGAGPANPDAKKVAKVAILMTDGLFNTAFAGVTGRPQGSQSAKSGSYAESICTNMKNDGIEVFTIGFDLDNKDTSKSERNAAKAVLKNCATPDSGTLKRYFEVSTGKELDEAFQTIARNIEQLSLTK
ncbi:pilus assembly protein [Aminobacter aganoensis]